MRLTDRFIRELSPPEKGNRIYYDDEVRGLGVRITAGGVKAFILNYRFGRRERRCTIGRAGDWSIVKARQRARELRRGIDMGEDPLADRQARREAITFGELAEEYIARHASKKLSGHRDDQRLRKDVLPKWKNRAAADIRPEDVIALVEAKAERTPVLANRLLSLITRVYNWGIAKRVVEHTPCVKIEKPGKERQRDRVLSEAEIRTFWTRLETAPASAAMKSILRLILLTAARPGEAATLEWCEIEGDWWTLPASKSKNGRAHRIFLTPLAHEQLGPRREGFIFPSRTGEGSIRPAVVSNAVVKLRKHIGLSAHWQAHDLRRTAASTMASIGIPRFIIHRLLNHADRDITGIYDRFGYDGPKKDALLKWEKELRRIIGQPEKAQVVEMRR